MMRPTLAGDELRRNLTHYLTTAFGLSEQPVREELAWFLNDPDCGIFHGPHLRTKTPFESRQRAEAMGC